MRAGMIRAIAVVLSVLGAGLAAAAAERPNILFIIADDASRHWGEAYHCDWAKTPNLDRLAKEGLVFDNAYVPTSKCAPCRAGLLTGRYPWQLEEAANHQNHFPAKFGAFPEQLQRQAAVHCGSAGKVWGPGSAVDADGRKRDFGLPAAQPARATPGVRFANFLASKKPDRAFFYWHGSADPHRPYEAGAGLKAGKKLTDIDRVPAYWPDNDTVRSDMLDYAMEIERFDAHVGELLAALEAAGAAANTLVVVTSDHGMPFPRVKGHTYDDAHRVPLLMRWPAGIKHPGRRVADLVSLIDLAPTFLALQGVAAPDAAMAPITGRSLENVLADAPDRHRPFVLIGRERNDVYARRGSPAGLGYPVRGIRQGDFLYIHNDAPERWPCGDPDLGLKDTDDSPTKRLLIALGPGDPYWEHAFGKRPAEQLFDVVNDPDCVANLAGNPDHAATQQQLRRTLDAELLRQNDPRALGQGDAFDQYPTVKKVDAGWPEANRGQSP